MLPHVLVSICMTWRYWGVTVDMSNSSMSGQRSGVDVHLYIPSLISILQLQLQANQLTFHVTQPYSGHSGSNISHNSYIQLNMPSYSPRLTYTSNLLRSVNQFIPAHRHTYLNCKSFSWVSTRLVSMCLSCADWSAISSATNRQSIGGLLRPPASPYTSTSWTVIFYYYTCYIVTTSCNTLPTYLQTMHGPWYFTHRYTYSHLTNSC